LKIGAIKMTSGCDHGYNVTLADGDDASYTTAMNAIMRKLYGMNSTLEAVHTVPEQRKEVWKAFLELPASVRNETLMKKMIATGLRLIQSFQLRQTPTTEAQMFDRLYMLASMYNFVGMSCNVLPLKVNVDLVSNRDLFCSFTSVLHATALTSGK
jgi:hypothetical protein